MNMIARGSARPAAVVGTLACAVAICLFVTQAYAQWAAGNGVAYTAGTPPVPPAEPPPYDPVNNNGLDGQFVKGINGQNKHYAKFMVQGCCIAAGYCPTNWQEGVQVWVDYTVHYEGGSQTGSEFKECCPKKCCDLTITATESVPGAWGGKHASSVTINVEVRCICCLGGMTMADDEWGHNRFLPQDLES